MQIEKFEIKFSQLNLKKESLPCVMGYSKDNIPSVLKESIDDVFSHGEDLCSCQGGYVIMDSVKWSRDDHSLSVGDLKLNIQKIVFGQIKKSESIALFLCTAGRQITERSKELMIAGDMLSGYVYDTFGSLVVESAMDLIQQSLNAKMSEAGLKITNRYSPGYCGWDVSEQKKLFKLLPENFCGVELTDSCLMMPVKSVSGIIGIGKSIKFNKYTCSLCDMKDCLYKNLEN